jgi:hypothetical protein
MSHSTVTKLGKRHVRDCLLPFAALVALVLSSLVSSGPRVAWALQAVLANDVFSVQHFITEVGDNTIRIINPTANPIPEIGSGPTDGMLCAMVYVYDSHEEQIECCGCPVTNNGLRTIGMIASLTSNPLGGPVPRAGLIKIVSALPNMTCPGPVGPGQSCPNPPPHYPCNPGISYTLQPTLRAWILHSDQVIAAGLLPAVQEAEFLDMPLDGNELSILRSTCAFIHVNGSGRGICTCGTGDDVAARPRAGGR